MRRLLAAALLAAFIPAAAGAQQLRRLELSVSSGVAYEARDRATAVETLMASVALAYRVSPATAITLAYTGNHFPDPQIACNEAGLWSCYAIPLRPRGVTAGAEVRLASDGVASLVGTWGAGAWRVDGSRSTGTHAGAYGGLGFMVGGSRLRAGFDVRTSAISASGGMLLTSIMLRVQAVPGAREGE